MSGVNGVNGVRGEVRATLGGTERRLCLTLGALAEIETGLGVAGVEALAARLRALSAADLSVVLAALLRGDAMGRDAADGGGAGRGAGGLLAAVAEGVALADGARGRTGAGARGADGADGAVSR